MKPHLAFFCILVFLSMSVVCRTAEVHVDERTIPLLFSQDVSTSFDTNRVARELSRYFSVGLGTERLFCLDEETETQAAPLRPVCPLVPPMSIASDIGIFTNAPERIVVGNIALSALLEAMDAAEPYSNTWDQAESLLSDLASGAITNDMQRARETFVMHGEILTSPLRDDEIRRGVSSYWSRLQYCPLSLLDWRSIPLVEDGTPVPGILFKYRDPVTDSSHVHTELLVFLNGRWRIAFPE